MNMRSCSLIVVTTLFALAIPVSGTAAPKHHRYKLIDIGTFGGPASMLPALAQVVNNRGILVGQADTSTVDPNFPNCFNLDCYVSHAFQSRDGVLTDLGALPGGGTSLAGWINARGLVVGLSQNGVIDPLTGGPEERAVLWEGGHIADLGTFGGNESVSISANDRGQVIGVALNAIPDPFSFFGATQTQARAFLWEHGAMEDLGTLGGPDAFGQVINDRGQVSGFSYISHTPNPSTGVPTVDPFLWEKGKGMQDLGGLGGTVGQVNDMNSQGQVVGTSNLAGDLFTHGFTWSKGVLTDVGTFGGDNSEADWVNNAGQVVGLADFPGGQIHHAFVWQGGLLTDLGTVGSDPCSRAFAINARGQVVGGSSDCSTSTTYFHAFLWVDGEPMIDLNTLIPPNSSLQLTLALFVSDSGKIAGVGVPPGCLPQNLEVCGHAYLLVPCGEGDGGCTDEAVGNASVPNLVERREVSGRIIPSPLISPAYRYRMSGLDNGPLGTRRFGIKRP
jgi:probable HAF family extracellular repeat protein